MAEFVKGKDGTVYVADDTVNYISNWSMTITPGIRQVPDLGSSGIKRAYNEYNDFSGSITAVHRYDSSTDTPQMTVEQMFASGGTEEAKMIKLVESSQSMWYGEVVFTNISKSQPAEGIQEWSADWAQSDGVLAWSTDTSTS